MRIYHTLRPFSCELVLWFVYSSKNEQLIKKMYLLTSAQSED